MDNKEIPSNEIEELARKYRILPSKITYVLSKYGSMENYINKYMNFGIDKVDNPEDIEGINESLLKDNVLNELIVDVAENSNRIGVKLLFCMRKRMEFIGYTGRRIIFYDSQKIAKEFDKLSVREKEVICLGAGIQDLEYYKSGIKHHRDDYLNSVYFKTIMNKFEDKRNVRESWWSFGEKHNLCLQQEEIEKRTKIFDEFYNSNFIFIPDNEYKDEPDTISHSEKIRMQAELSKIKQLQFSKIEADSIKKLNFPTHVRHSLEHAGILTITQLKSMTDEELMQLDNVGKDNLEQIKIKIFELIDSQLVGLKIERDSLAEKLKYLKEQAKEAEKLLSSYDSILDKRTIDSDRDDSIKNLFLPKHLCKALLKDGVETITQLRALSKEQIIEKYRPRSFKVYNNKR